ncbi:hypothetical protein DL93DRAFT_2093882 [Clavulina sp. PMI_390]|nr:hypothetical protein DL93DRAFT_2093882 [Clavulina sp. PMI_390]
MAYPEGKGELPETQYSNPCCIFLEASHRTPIHLRRKREPAKVIIHLDPKQPLLALPAHILPTVHLNTRKAVLSWILSQTFDKAKDSSQLTLLCLPGEKSFEDRQNLTFQIKTQRLPRIRHNPNQVRERRPTLFSPGEGRRRDKCLRMAKISRNEGDVGSIRIARQWDETRLDVRIPDPYERFYLKFVALVAREKSEAGKKSRSRKTKKTHKTCGRGDQELTFPSPSLSSVLSPICLVRPETHYSGAQS